MSKKIWAERKGIFLAVLYFSCMTYILVKGFMNKIAGYPIAGCKMDGIVFGMGPRQYMMIFWLPYFIVFYRFFRLDFSENLILRKEKKERILYEQQLKILEFAVMFQLLFFGISLLSGGNFCLCTWNSRESMFYGNTLQTTNLSGVELLIVIAVIGIVRLIIIGNIINLCFWYTNSLLLGNVIIIVGFICESIFAKVRFVTRWCKADYHFFAFGVEKWRLVIYLFVNFLCMVGLYWYILRKKEFFKK